ncbi:MAG: hypothetical protein AAFV43_02170 [Planctomycetota bacterium]
MNQRSLLKRALLTLAMVGAFGFATAGTAGEAEARRCYGGGYGGGGFYGAPGGFYGGPAIYRSSFRGPGYGYRSFYRGGYYGAPRGFYGGPAFYGGGGRGFGLTIGF